LPDALSLSGELKICGEFMFGVADLSKELTDAVALCADLGVCGLQSILGVEGSLPPGRLSLGVLLGVVVPPAGGGLGDGGVHQLAGVVVVEEGAGDIGFSELEMIF
jgi:hypothetical protein